MTATATKGYRITNVENTRVDYTAARICTLEHLFDGEPGANVTIVVTTDGGNGSMVIHGQVTPATKAGWMNEALAYFVNEHPANRSLVTALRQIAEDGANGKSGSLELSRSPASL